MLFDPTVTLGTVLTWVALAVYMLLLYFAVGRPLYLIQNMIADLADLVRPEPPKKKGVRTARRVKVSAKRR